MKRFFCLILATTTLLACTSNKPNQTVTEELNEPIEAGIEPDSICSTPQCIIYLQPFEEYSNEEAKKIISILQDKFNSYLYGHWEFQILPEKKLPSHTYVKNLNRYKATAILNYEKKFVKNGEMIIGLTHKDICMDIHGKKNYGIIGCSFKPSQVCIVSDKRLKNKEDYWKPILHEFIHAFYNAGHCPEDNDSCIMQDGKGKGDFTNKNSLCNSCKQ